MTTIEATLTEQAYCRGCASPTFMFDPNAAYPAYSMYCDNCFGTRTKYGYDEGEGCGDCEGCDEDGECENNTCHDEMGRGNTNQHDPILDSHDFHRLMQYRHPGVEYRGIPLAATPPPVAVGTTEHTRPGILDHTCQCGSTEFYMQARATCTVMYEAVNLTDLLDETADFEIDAHTYVIDDERDDRVRDAMFICCSCERNFTGNWCS